MEISHKKTIKKITLWKISIKPENYPIEKADHLANLHFWVQNVVFSWVYLSFPNCRRPETSSQGNRVDSSVGSPATDVRFP